MDNKALTLTPVEAGRLLGVGRGVAYRLIHEGTIPSLKLGKKLRVPRVALDRMLACETGQAHGEDA